MARRAGLVALVAVNLLGLNWYVAGRFDMADACRDGRWWTVGHVLLSRPGSARQPLADGRTLLHRAADGEGADVAVIRFLLAAGADASARDDAGQTALDGCRTNPDIEPETRRGIEAVLLAHGAETGAELDAEKDRPAEVPAKPEPGK